MAAKTDVLERLRACHKEAQAAIRSAREVDEQDGGAFSLDESALQPPAHLVGQRRTFNSSVVTLLFFFMS